LKSDIIYSYNVAMLKVNKQKATTITEAQCQTNWSSMSD